MKDLNHTLRSDRGRDREQMRRQGENKGERENN